MVRRVLTLSAIVAGLTAASIAATKESTIVVVPAAQIGYGVYKLTDSELAGAVVGGATGAAAAYAGGELGAKIGGLFGGIVGAAIGGAVGAL